MAKMSNDFRPDRGFVGNFAALSLISLLLFFLSLSGAEAKVKAKVETEESTQLTPPPSSPSPPSSCGRIVSLAPSLTELAFALGLGGDVVGVTRYCRYPEATRSIPKVGGFLDPNYEAIFLLKPDHVLLLKEHHEAESYLKELGIDGIRVNHNTVESILESVRVLSEFCGREAEGEALLEDLNGRVERVKVRGERFLKERGGKRPRVLISIGRDVSAGGITEVYVAGKDGFYDAMIELSGGENAYLGREIKFPVISIEGLRELKPDIIIDLVPSITEEGVPLEMVKEQWRILPMKGSYRVEVLGGDYVSKPGPRFIQTLEDISRAVYLD